MPKISPALSDIIKRSFFRAREHLECLAPDQFEPHARMLALLTYEVARTLGVPAVRSTADDTPVEYHIADTLRNLTSVIDFDLTALELTGDPEEVALCARELLNGVQTIPLPSAPPAKAG
jgi:hypothetical protein